MNEYEGLNLPQLLDLMHELVIPEPVSLMPETPGWWVILGWFLAVVFVAAWHIAKRWRVNRYRREALAMLAAIESQSEDDPAAAAEQIPILLKRTALVAYPRREIAQLYGAEWAQFLCESADNDPDVEQAAERIASAAYRAGTDGSALFAPARRWIKVHRA